VQFTLSFLRWNDGLLTASAVAIKGLYSNIWRGLYFDWAEHAIPFMDAIAKHVLQNRAVPRPSKLFVFPAFVLRQLCGLLEAVDGQVADEALKLLIEFCADVSLLQAPKQHELLLEMCLDLRPLQQRQITLLVAVMKAHPVLQAMYFMRSSLFLQSRHNMQWFFNVHFLVEALSLNVEWMTKEDRRRPWHLEGEVAVVDQAAAALGALMPLRTITRTVLSQALLQTESFVLVAALKLLRAVLTRLGDAASCGLYKGAIQRELEKQAAACLPDFNTLIPLWQKLLQVPDVEMTKDEDLDRRRIVKMLRIPKAGLQPHMLFDLWCDVAEGYCRALPESMLDVKFDWSKMFSVPFA
jgi:hypothetical protein